jgi:cytosine/adenosine deaminase-related metal-dependent hydrolase
MPEYAIDVRFPFHPPWSQAEGDRTIPARVLTAEWVIPVCQEPIHQGYVCFEPESGRILSVGQLSEFEATLPPAPPGTLLSPGLVNAHLHLEQSFPQPIPKSSGTPFSQWLLDVVAKNREHQSVADKIARCRFGAAELLQTGTTCVNDIASGRESLEVLDAFGLRGVVSLEYFYPGGNDGEPLKLDFIKNAYQAFRAGYEDHPRLQAGLSPHSLYNVSLPVWKALRDVCDPPFIHAHVGEWEGEMAYFQEEENAVDTLHETLLGRRFSPPKPRQTPIQHLAQAQLLDEMTLLAHGVHTNADDLEQLMMHLACIAHCPRSNLFLHGKTIDWAQWSQQKQATDSGVILALGTDGRLSTPNLDLREEARLAMRLHGWTARQAVQAITENGAISVNRLHEVGSLAAGLFADVVLWQCDPSQDTNIAPEAMLLAETTQVNAVYIGGERRWPLTENEEVDSFAEADSANALQAAFISVNQPGGAVG